MKKYLSLVFLNYLRILAKLQLAKVSFLQRLKNKPLTIVGITGSAGKTSTLLACQAVLAPNFVVKTNYGGNSETGIPLSILGLKTSDFSYLDWLKIALLAPIKILTNWQTYQIFLVEMGIDGPDEPKNMSYLLKIIRPKIGIFLNVTSVHSAYFDHLAHSPQEVLSLIAHEKAKLILSLPSDGYALLNPYDSHVIKSVSSPLAQKVLLDPKSTSSLKLQKYVFPEAFRYSLAAALALAKIFCLNDETAVSNLQNNLTFPPSRSSLFKGINHSQIIDSSYNSSPIPTQEMLSLLKTYKSPRIAVLGDMRELGNQSSECHHQIYESALDSADQVISVGPETKKYFGDKAKKFDYWWQAAQYLKKNLPQHSTILVKGSQNTIFLEEVVKELLENPADSSQLCRQSKYWQNTKNQFRQSHLKA